MAPGTEFARDFCAGIGPLQLGAVLVYYTTFIYTIPSQFESIFKEIKGRRKKLTSHQLLQKFYLASRLRLR